MKSTKIVLFSLFSVLSLESAIAEVINTQKAEKIVNIGQVNGNVIGISDETVKMLVTNFERQHKADAETIKQYEQMINDLRHGNVNASVSSIQAAFAALKKGDNSLAEALFEKSAEEELKKARESNKQAAKAFRNLGTLRWWDSQKALTAYRRATELDPDNTDGWNQLGHLLNRAGDLDETITAYKKVLALGETHQDQQEIAIALGNLGNVYQTRGELDKAIEFHQQALTLDEALGNKQGMAEDYGNLGNVYKTRGELDKAIEFHQKALMLNEALGRKEGMATAYGNLGSVYEQKGNTTEAKRYYQQSIELFKYIGSPMEKKVQGWLDKL